MYAQDHATKCNGAMKVKAHLASMKSSKVRSVYRAFIMYVQSTPHCYNIITPCPCARGKVIGRIVVIVVHKKSPNLWIQAPQQLEVA